LLIGYEKEEAILKTFMEKIYQIPDRNLRKQLANQFYGNLAKKT
jgi:hypothetical protein